MEVMFREGLIPAADTFLLLMPYIGAAQLQPLAERFLRETKVSGQVLGVGSAVSEAAAKRHPPAQCSSCPSAWVRPGGGCGLCVLRPLRAACGFARGGGV